MWWLPEGRGKLKGKGGEIHMVTQEDLTLSGGHTVQYTDDVSELYTGNLYNFINQSHPNKFNFF